MARDRVPGDRIELCRAHAAPVFDDPEERIAMQPTEIQ